MTLALYRKYRPASFAAVVGQEHVTEPLRTALGAGRIHHAYLFSGPRGCGKTSSARILARSLNCEQGPTPDPCGVCDSCIALAPEGPGSIDVIELDAASHGGVDDARDLRDRAFYAPAQSRYRVFIIDEAHMVTTQGFNALLKIVEEPPDHLVFVFATTEPDKVLATIRSRTHHYPFRLIPPGTLRALLERICADEGVTVAPAVYPLVIKAGGGSARDALSVLDQLLAGAGPDGVTYQGAAALLGVTDVAVIDDVVDALAASDGAAVFGAVHRLVEAGHDPRRFAADLLDRLRDLTLIKVAPEAASRLIEAPGDQLERMAEQAQRIGQATLTRYAEILHIGLTEMRGATAPRLLLELLCARMLLPAASASDAALLDRLERIERRVAMAPPPAAAAPVSGDARQDDDRHARAAPPQEEAPPAEPEGQLDATAVRRVWSEILLAARERSRSTEALLSNATVRTVEGNTLVLTIGSAPLAKRLSEQRNTEVIVEALRAVLGVDWQVRCEHEGGTPAEPAVGASNQPTRPPAGRKRAPTNPPPAEHQGSAGSPDDEDAMLAEAADGSAQPSERRDPEEAAIELLSAQLGARAVDPG